MSDLKLIAIITAIAVGFFCLGRVYEITRRFGHWRNGFNAAKEIYEKRSI